MRAAILVESNQPLVVDELTMPPLGVGQVRVQVEYAAICGAQIGEIAASKGPDKYLPHLLGHEGVGQVTAIGAGVTTKAVGDWVILHWRPSEGIAAKGATYLWHNGAPGEPPVLVNSGPMTCFSDETIVSENRLTRLPDGLDHRVAPLFGCAFTTAYGVVCNDAQVKVGDRVLVIGYGGVGIAVVEMAEQAGASVTVVERVPGKAEIWRQWDGRARNFDVAIDTTGDAAAIQLAYDLTHGQGKVILVGVPRYDDPISIDSLPLHFGKQIIGSQGGWCVPHQDIPRIAQRGPFQTPAQWISHEVTLEDINEGLDIVRSGQARRVLVRMN